MPRKNFLSKTTFVDASEQQIKDTILSLPAYIPVIRFISENKPIESLRFSYEQPTVSQSYFIDVTVLPLNDQYTRISLHATYSNGHAFYEDAEVAVALHDFESAIQAAIKGELAQFKPCMVKQHTSSRLTQLMNNFRSSIAFFFLRKKLS